VILPHVNSGAMRILALSSPQRVSGTLAAIPTLKEQGIDAVVDNFRFIMAAPGLQPAQTAYWDNIMRQMTQSAEWRKDLKDNQWENTFMNSADTRKYLDAQYAKLKDALTALGLAK
jgi:putative tricarboxylic transport membrane protein